MVTAGFFVDWNGDTRRTDGPSDHYRCIVDKQTAHVDVIDGAGFVIHECTYFPTLESVRAADVIVNLVP